MALVLLVLRIHVLPSLVEAEAVLYVLVGTQAPKPLSVPIVAFGKAQNSVEAQPVLSVQVL